MSPGLFLPVCLLLWPVFPWLVPVLALLPGWPPFLVGTAPLAPFALTGGDVFQREAHPHRAFTQPQKSLASLVNHIDTLYFFSLYPELFHPVLNRFLTGRP